MERRKRRRFTKAYKAEVVELVRKSGKSIGAVAKELDLTETALREWVRQGEVDAGSGVGGRVDDGGTRGAVAAAAAREDVGDGA